MTALIANITFDCENALVVGQFWSQVLERPLDPGGDTGFCSIGRRDAGRSQPAWFFEKVSERKTAKNRVHVDLVDGDPHAVDRFVTLGASLVGEHDFGSGQHHWTVLQDPEGNEFCVSPKTFAS